MFALYCKTYAEYERLLKAYQRIDNIAINCESLEQYMDDSEVFDVMAMKHALKHGWNYLLTDQASPLNVTVFGRTLVNLLGKDGNCEHQLKFTSVSSTKRSLTISLRIFLLYYILFI